MKMKRLIVFTSLLFVLAFGGITGSAQISRCDGNTTSPIKCGFYEEGYQDGVADATRSRSNDYRRYRSKYDSQYESFYRNGYSAGFDSVRPTVRWTNSQRSAYDSGYTIGQNDRRNSGQTRESQNPMGGYDQNIGLYFQQGYSDGFSNRPRTYDVVLTGTIYPPPGGGGGAVNTAIWNGQVDDRAELIIRGNTITTRNVSGNGIITTFQQVNGTLPRRPTTISARKTNGRGDVFVIQQPAANNNFTAIVQIYDNDGGQDNYGVEMSWTGGGWTGAEESYRSGSVSWRGRVDGTVNIIIAGSDVQSEDISGSGLSGTSFYLTGYLANRTGSLRATRRNGRGNVTVIQQPARDNGFIAIVQITDPRSGSDNYQVDINW